MGIEYRNSKPTSKLYFYGIFNYVTEFDKSRSLVNY